MDGNGQLDETQIALTPRGRCHDSSNHGTSTLNLTAGQFTGCTCHDKKLFFVFLLKPLLLEVGTASSTQSLPQTRCCERVVACVHHCVRSDSEDLGKNNAMSKNSLLLPLRAPVPSETLRVAVSWVKPSRVLRAGRKELNSLVGGWDNFLKSNSGIPECQTQTLLHYSGVMMPWCWFFFFFTSTPHL